MTADATQTWETFLRKFRKELPWYAKLTLLFRRRRIRKELKTLKQSSKIIIACDTYRIPKSLVLLKEPRSNPPVLLIHRTYSDTIPETLLRRFVVVETVPFPVYMDRDQKLTLEYCKRFFKTLRKGQ